MKSPGVIVRKRWRAQINFMTWTIALATTAITASATANQNSFFIVFSGIFEKAANVSAEIIAAKNTA